MGNVPTKKNWGRATENENYELVQQLDEMYTTFSTSINTSIKRFVFKDRSAVASSDFNRNMDIGDIWIRQDTDTAWIMTSRATANEVTWKQIT